MIEAALQDTGLHPALVQPTVFLSGIHDGLKPS